MKTEEMFKIIALNFVCFMHYIATGLVFFVPIDVGHYVFGMSQLSAILVGSFVLWIWSFITALIIMRHRVD